MPAPARNRPPAHDPTEKITFAEFGRREAWSEFKHEYHAGYAVPVQGPDAYPLSPVRRLGMAGATPNHSKITASANTAIGRRLDGSACHVHSSDLMIRVEVADRGYYPDLSVICGEPIPAEGSTLTATNPHLIVEVTSVSTEDIDRGRKRLHYLQLPTLRDYLIVDQYEVSVEHQSRDSDDVWRTTLYRNLNDMIALPSLDVGLPLIELYRGVRFEPHPGERTRPDPVGPERID